jgi:hypothetical protein
MQKCKCKKIKERKKQVLRARSAGNTDAKDAS